MRSGITASATPAAPTRTPSPPTCAPTRSRARCSSRPTASARVAEVKRSLGTRRRVIDFALRAQEHGAGRAAGGVSGDVPRMIALDLPRIQGFVVRGYRLPFAGYLFLRIEDVARAAAWIAEITERSPHGGDVVGEARLGRERRLQLCWAARARAAGRRRSPASRRSSARAWPRARSCSATTVTARRRTGRAASGRMRSTCS